MPYFIDDKPGSIEAVLAEIAEEMHSVNEYIIPEEENPLHKTKEFLEWLTLDKSSIDFKHPFQGKWQEGEGYIDMRAVMMKWVCIKALEKSKGLSQKRLQKLVTERIVPNKQYTYVDLNQDQILDMLAKVDETDRNIEWKCLWVMSTTGDDLQEDREE